MVSKPEISKKHVKIGLAGLAVVALVIGLSVGLTSKNSSSKSSAASNASGGYNTASTNGTKPQCDIYTGWSSGGWGSKSSKSNGGWGSKSSKSSGDWKNGGGWMSSKNNGYGTTEATKPATTGATMDGYGNKESSNYSNNGGMMETYDGGNYRGLKVPGTEDAELNAGKRRKLRNDLIRELQYNDGTKKPTQAPTKDGDWKTDGDGDWSSSSWGSKSSKSSGDWGSKSSKGSKSWSSDGEWGSMKECTCPTEYTTTTGWSGKSGKSNGGWGSKSSKGSKSWSSSSGDWKNGGDWKDGGDYHVRTKITTYNDWDACDVDVCFPDEIKELQYQNKFPSYGLEPMCIDQDKFCTCLDGCFPTTEKSDEDQITFCLESCLNIKDQETVTATTKVPTIKNEYGNNDSKNYGSTKVTTPNDWDACTYDTCFAEGIAPLQYQSKFPISGGEPRCIDQDKFCTCDIGCIPLAPGFDGDQVDFCIESCLNCPGCFDEPETGTTSTKSPTIKNEYGKNDSTEWGSEWDSDSWSSKSSKGSKSWGSGSEWGSKSSKGSKGWAPSVCVPTTPKVTTTAATVTVPATTTKAPPATTTKAPPVTTTAVCKDCTDWYFSAETSTAVCYRVVCGEELPGDAKTKPNLTSCCASLADDKDICESTSRDEPSCVTTTVATTTTSTAAAVQPLKTPQPTYSVTEGSTPTVSTEATSPPTMAPRPTKTPVRL